MYYGLRAAGFRLYKEFPRAEIITRKMLQLPFLLLGLSKITPRYPRNASKDLCVIIGRPRSPQPANDYCWKRFNQLHKFASLYFGLRHGARNIFIKTSAHIFQDSSPGSRGYLRNSNSFLVVVGLSCGCGLIVRPFL